MSHGTVIPYQFRLNWRSLASGNEYNKYVIRIAGSAETALFSRRTNLPRMRVPTNVLFDPNVSVWAWYRAKNAAFSLLNFARALVKKSRQNVHADQENTVFFFKYSRTPEQNSPSKARSIRHVAMRIEHAAARILSPYFKCHT